MWAEEMGVMMQFWEDFGKKSWTGEEGILTKEDLGINEPLEDMEQSFAALKF